MQSFSNKNSKSQQLEPKFEPHQLTWQHHIIPCQTKCTKMEKKNMNFSVWNGIVKKESYQGGGGGRKRRKCENSNHNNKGKETKEWIKESQAQPKQTIRDNAFKIHHIK